MGAEELEERLAEQIGEQWEKKKKRRWF